MPPHAMFRLSTKELCKRRDRVLQRPKMGFRACLFWGTALKDEMEQSRILVQRPPATMPLACTVPRARPFCHTHLHNRAYYWLIISASCTSLSLFSAPRAPACALLFVSPLPSSRGSLFTTNLLHNVDDAMTQPTSMSTRVLSAWSPEAPAAMWPSSPFPDLAVPGGRQNLLLDASHLLEWGSARAARLFE